MSFRPFFFFFMNLLRFLGQMLSIVCALNLSFKNYTVMISMKVP